MTANSGNRGQIIWPIAQKLFRSVMNQQRPRWTGGRRIPVGDSRNAGTRPVLPWNFSDRPPVINFGRNNTPPVAADVLPGNFALCAVVIQPVIPSKLTKLTKLKKPSVVHSLKPMPTAVFKLTGVSKDSAGAVLSSCTMSLFRVDYDSGRNIVYTFLGQTISDASGNYSFNVNTNSNYRVTGDKGGGTPVAGITLNTLIGTLS